MFKRLVSLINRYPRWIVATVAVFTVVLGIFLKDLRIEAEVRRMLPENEPGVRVLDILDKEFGGSEQVVVLLETEGLFVPGALYQLESLVARLEGLSEVNQVVGLTNLQDVQGLGEEVVVSRLIESIPADPRRLEELKQQLLVDKRYRGRLLGEDGKSTLLLVRLSPGVDKVAAVQKIEGVVAEQRVGSRISLAGSPALMKFMRDWMAQDLLRLVPLVLMVLILVLAIAFRSWPGVLLPLLSVGVAVVWMMGLVALTRQPLTIVLVVLPPVVLSVGSAYGIHIIKRWQEEKRRRDNNGRVKIVERVVGNAGMPVFMAMATTAVGFAANIVTRVVSIRSFAVFSVVGVMFSFLLAVVFLPAMLVLIEGKVRKDEAQGIKESGWLRNWFGRWADGIFRRRWLILGGALVIFAVALVLGTRVKTETDFVRYFKPGSAPTIAAKVVNEQFGGGLQFEIIIDGDIQDPAVLRQMERFVSDLKQVPHITHITSIVDVLKATNRAFNGDQPEFEVLPETREGVAQFLLLLSFSGSDYLADMVTADYQRARITAQFNEGTSSIIGFTEQKIKEVIARDFDGRVKVLLGGVPVAIYALHRGIQTSQFWSLVVALSAVFLLVTVMFRSPLLGVAAMVPIGWTLAVAFGLMGALDVEIDVVTAMLGAIALGIGIDYSCHFIARFQEEGRAGIKGRERLRRTLIGVGPPIVANAVAVGLGFAVLVFSSLVIIQKFGILIAGAMILSSVGALLLLPAIFAVFSRECVK